MAIISTSLPIIIALTRELQQSAVKYYVENVFLQLYDQIKPSGQFTRLLKKFFFVCVLFFFFFNLAALNNSCGMQDLRSFSCSMKYLSEVVHGI